MKSIIHTIAALLLLTFSAQADAISKVQTEKQKATIDARLDAGQELRIFIGDESLGWSSTPPKAGPVTATVEASRQIRLDDGSLGRGFIFRVRGSTAYVAITPDGPVPFGELVFRTKSKVSTKDGVHTFADIRKPDGMLVPVSVRVRASQPHGK